MFKIGSPRNLKFIQQFSSAEVNLDTKEVENDPGYIDFITEVKKSKLKSIDVLEGLNSGYVSKVPVHQLIKKEELEFHPSGFTEISASVIEAFDHLMLNLGREVIGYRESESGRINFNHKDFAEMVMRIYSLTMDRKDPEILLVYNNEKGYW